MNFSPDNQLIFTSSGSQGVSAWDVNTARLEFELKDEDIRDITLTTTKDLVLIKNYGPLEIRRKAADGIYSDLIFSDQYGDHFFSLATSANEPRILAGSVGEAVLYLNEGQGKTTLSHNSQEKVTAVQFSSNDKYLLTATTSQVKLWDGQGRALQTFSADGFISSASFSNDNKSVIIAYDNGRIEIRKIFLEEWRDGTLWNRLSKLSSSAQKEYEIEHNYDSPPN